MIEELFEFKDFTLSTIKYVSNTPIIEYLKETFTIFLIN